MKNLLRIVREALEITQADLAAQSGITRPQLSYIEGGKCIPRSDTQRAFTNILKQRYRDRAPLEPDTLDKLVKDYLWPPDDLPPGGGKEPSKPSRNKSRRRVRSTPIRDESQSAAATATVDILDTLRDADFATVTKVYWSSACNNKTRKRIRSFVRENFVELKDLSDAAIRQRLVRQREKLGGGKERGYSQDPKVQARRAAIFEIIAPVLAYRRKEFHSKGAYQNRSQGDRRAILQGILDTPEIQEQLMTMVGYIPSIEECESILRERLGKVDAHKEWECYLGQTIGYKAAYAGQVMTVDATGIPYDVVLSRGGNQKYERRFGHFIFDIASGMGQTYLHVGNSETLGWDPALKQWIFDIAFAPEMIVCDKVSKFFSGIRYLNPEKPTKMSDGCLLWLAAGVRPYVHQPGRATGSAHAESNIRHAKNLMARVSTKKAVAQELRGFGLQKFRKFQSEIEFQDVWSEFNSLLNERSIRGSDVSRATLWERGQEERQGRLISDNLKEGSGRFIGDRELQRWQDIIYRAKVSTLTRGRVRAKIDGKSISADLTTDAKVMLRDSGVSPTELVTLTFPGGLLKSDDPDLIRCVVVAPRDKGEPLYFNVEARSTKVDKYFQDISKPLIGDFKAAIEGSQESFARERDKQAAIWKQRVSGLKEGTTDTAVGSPEDVISEAMRGE